MVDDDVSLCQVMKVIFEKEGFAVAIEHTVASSLRRVVEDRFAIVLLDVVLPDGRRQRRFVRVSYSFRLAGHHDDRNWRRRHTRSVPGRRRSRLPDETLLDFQAAHHDSPLYLGDETEWEQGRRRDCDPRGSRDSPNFCGIARAAKRAVAKPASTVSYDLNDSVGISIVTARPVPDADCA
jgi:hypothetical protein